jgi:hypothetical protein
LRAWNPFARAWISGVNLAGLSTASVLRLVWVKVERRGVQRVGAVCAAILLTSATVQAQDYKVDLGAQKFCLFQASCSARARKSARREPYSWSATRKAIGKTRSHHPIRLLVQSHRESRTSIEDRAGWFCRPSITAGLLPELVLSNRPRLPPEPGRERLAIAQEMPWLLPGQHFLSSRHLAARTHPTPEIAARVCLELETAAPRGRPPLDPLQRLFTLPVAYLGPHIRTKSLSSSW